MLKRAGKTLGCLIVAAILVGVDQWVKAWVLTALKGGRSILVIPHILQFTYVENYGAAFNLLNNQRWLLVVFGIVLSIVMIYVLFRSFDEKNKGNIVLSLERVCLVMILSGAVGNIIDRVWRIYVVDFLQVLFIDFPVFNIADCLIVVGCILMLILVFLEDKKTAVKDAAIEETKETQLEDVGESKADE